MNHQIRILPAAQPGRFDVSGAVDLHDTGAPILDAAQALIAAGASPSDTLQASGADVTFSPMPLGKLAAPRPRTLRSTADYQHALARQEPISASSRR